MVAENDVLTVHVLGKNGDPYGDFEVLSTDKVMHLKKQLGLDQPLSTKFVFQSNPIQDCKSFEEIGVTSGATLMLVAVEFDLEETGLCGVWTRRSGDRDEVHELYELHSCGIARYSMKYHDTREHTFTSVLHDDEDEVGLGRWVERVDGTLVIQCNTLKKAVNRNSCHPAPMRGSSHHHVALIDQAEFKQKYSFKCALSREESERARQRLPSEEYAKAQEELASVANERENLMDQKKQSAIALFRVWDRDGDGFISEMELREVLGKLGLPLDVVHMIFMSADKNHDGMVDYSEFLDWVYTVPGVDTQAKIVSSEIVGDGLKKACALSFTHTPTVSDDVKVRNLSKRFPQATEEQVRRALEASGGHAGKAAAFLMPSSTGLLPK